MNEYKRKLRSFTKEIKNSRKKVNNDRETISITSIENLSNELFYDIIDYLNACDIYEAFSNLNSRFQQFLNSSSLLFKFKCNYLVLKPGKIFMNNCKRIIRFNRQQILSIHLWLPDQMDKFFSSFTIDSSFSHLESITLTRLHLRVLMSVLIKLPSLPRLFCLNIEIFMGNAKHLNLTDIYRIIFTLPMLKCCELYVNYVETSFSLPIATNKQFSPIEYLVLDHYCTFEELYTITSYTPQLRRLHFMHTDKIDLNIEIFVRVPLSHLTFISINEYPQKFDEFQIFISQIEWKLKFLYITTESKDVAYFDANRWEELILKYLPHLKVFHLQYDEFTCEENESPLYLGEPNQFTSSFWIERQWLFEAEIDYDRIIYSVCPYKERWYQYDAQYKVINSSGQLSKSSRLILTIFPPDECLYLFMININYILAVAQIYHLEIRKRKVFIDTLIEIINCLPELNSLKIHSLSLYEPSNSYEEEGDTSCSTEGTNKITKVYLEEINDIQDIYFIMAFCPYMAYLKVNLINNMDIESYLRNIFKKINHDCIEHLRLLCFRVLAADDEMIKKLDKMINSEKLIFDYTIKRVCDNIYLQWK